MVNAMAPQNKESLFVRMIKLIQQIFLEGLPSARRSRDRRALLLEEWGEGAKPQITRMAWTCVCLQPDGKEEPVFFGGGRPHSLNTVAPILPTTLGGAAFTGWVFCLELPRPRFFTVWSKCSFCCKQFTNLLEISVEVKTLQSEHYLPELIDLSSNCWVLKVKSVLEVNLLSTLLTLCYFKKMKISPFKADLLRGRRHCSLWWHLVTFVVNFLFNLKLSGSILYVLKNILAWIVK